MRKLAAEGFSERRDMEALDRALERYERLLAKGVSADAAAREASKLLTPGAAPLFVIADAVRVSLAYRRLNEVQGLFARAGTHVLGVPGTNVAGALDDMDPHIAQLIRDTLADAEQQINAAAKILITQHSDSQALGRLANV